MECLSLSRQSPNIKDLFILCAKGFPPTLPQCVGDNSSFVSKGFPYQQIVPLPVFIIAPNMSINKEILATVFTFECRGQKIFDGTKAGVLGVVKSLLAVV